MKLSKPFKKVFNQRFARWLIKRMPAQKSFVLNYRNTFIFPSKFGIHFLLLCFILFLLGTNYQNNLILFLLFFLCSFMLTSLLLSYRNLAGLSLAANPVKAQFAAQDCIFNLRIDKPSRRGQQLEFCFQENSSVLKSLVTEQQVHIYSFCSRRGWFNPGRVTVRSTFPFGLFTVWTHLDFALSALLYPQPIACSQKFINYSAADVNEGATYVAGVEQFSTLKSYQPGESLKSVAWKQLAQGRGWLSKQFEQPQGGDVLLELETYKNTDLEIKLCFICYQIIELEDKKINYALKLNNQLITANHGVAHKDKCLKALALFGENS